jgi:hypothetical protein
MGCSSGLSSVASDTEGCHAGAAAPQRCGGPGGTASDMPQQRNDVHWKLKRPSAHCGCGPHRSIGRSGRSRHWGLPLRMSNRSHAALLRVAQRLQWTCTELHCSNHGLTRTLCTSTTRHASGARVMGLSDQSRAVILTGRRPLLPSTTKTAPTRSHSKPLPNLEFERHDQPRANTTQRPAVTKRQEAGSLHRQVPTRRDCWQHGRLVSHTNDVSASHSATWLMSLTLSGRPQSAPV